MFLSGLIQKSKPTNSGGLFPAKISSSETPNEDYKSGDQTNSVTNYSPNQGVGVNRKSGLFGILKSSLHKLDVKQKEFEQAQSMKNILRILNSKAKTDQDMQQLLHYCKEMHFFKEFLLKYMKENEEAALIKLVSEMSLEEYPAHSMILKENDPSNNKLYIIQDGNVQIFKKIQKNVFEDDFSNFLVRSQSKVLATKTSSNAIILGRGQSNILDTKTNSDAIDGSTKQSLMGAIGGLFGKKIDKSQSGFKAEEELKPKPEIQPRVGVCGDKLDFTKGIGGRTSQNQIDSPKNNKKKETFVHGGNVIAPITEANSENELDEREILNEGKDEQNWLEQQEILYGPKILKLEKGYMFGELALLNTQPRAATILAEVDCKFLVLRKKQFEYIKKFYSNEMVVKRDFLFNVMPTLNEINADKYVTDILINFSNVGLTKGTFITKQDVLGDKIYFLRQGVCKIQYRLPSKKLITMCEVSSGTVIGEECLFSTNNKYTFTAVVQSGEAKFFTLYRKYMQKSIPFSTLKDLKTCYDMKEKARINNMERQALDKDLVDKLDTKSKIFVKEPLMCVNRRITTKKNEPIEQHPIEQNIEHQKYFKANFQRYQSIEDVKWSAAMMDNLQKKNSDNHLDLEDIQNWRKDQQNKDPIAFNKQCADVAIRFNNAKKPGFNAEAENKKENVNIAKAQLQTNEDADDNPLWDLDDKDIFDEKKKQGPKNYTKIHEKYKKKTTVKFLPQPEIDNFLQKRVKNIKKFTKSCQNLPDSFAEGEGQSSKVNLQIDVGKRVDQKSSKSLHNFKVRDGSPLRSRVSERKNSCVSIEIDSKTIADKDMMNISPLMKTTPNFLNDFSLRLNSVTRTSQTPRQINMKLRCATDNTDASNDCSATQPILKCGAKSLVNTPKLVNDNKKLISSNNPINIFKPFGQGPINRVSTMNNKDCGKKIGSPFQEAYSQRYGKPPTQETQISICSNTMRDEIHGNTEKMDQSENQLRCPKIVLKTDVRTTFDKKNYSVADVNIVKNTGADRAKTNLKERMTSSVSNPNLFQNRSKNDKSEYDRKNDNREYDQKNGKSGYILTKDIKIIESHVNMPVSQKYDDLKNYKPKYPKSARNYASTIVNKPIKIEEKQAQDQMKNNRNSKRNTNTIKSQRGSRNSLNMKDPASRNSLNTKDPVSRKSIQNLVNKLTPYCGSGKTLKVGKPNEEPQQQVMMPSDELDDIEGNKNLNFPNNKDSLSGSVNKKNQSSRFEGQKKNETLKTFIQRKSKEIML